MIIMFLEEVENEEIMEGAEKHPEDTDSVPDSVQEEADDSGENEVTSENDVFSDLGNLVTKDVAELQSRPESRSDTVTTATPESERRSASIVTMLPWGAHKERSPYMTSLNIDMDIRPGEFVMRTLFADFTVQAEKKIETVLSEPQEKPLSKVLQRGEDAQFDQLLSAFGCVAEHCLPSILRALFAWYERQIGDLITTEAKKTDQKGKGSVSF